MQCQGKGEIKVKYGWVFLLCFLLFSGCGENESAIKVDLTEREQVILKEEHGVITYAYLPQYSHTISHFRHHSLIQYLRKETGLNIKQIFPDTFDEHMKMVGQEKIDISYSNPFIYIKIAHRYGAKAFARIVEMTGKDKFRGQIICRADNSSIKNIYDCRNKRWIAVDSTSAGGYLYPLGHCIDHGITKKDFKELKANNNHSEGVVNNFLMIPGVEVAVFLKEEAKEISANLRTKDKFDVSKVAVKFGGGGHKRASGFKSSHKKLADIKQKLIKEIKWTK